MTNDQTVTQALEGCPFCGQAPTIEPWHGGAPTKVMIGCPGLHPDDDIAPCEVAPQVTGETPAEAIGAWNTRAEGARPSAPSGKVSEHIETLNWLSGQYLPGGPRDVKGAIRAAITALNTRTAHSGEGRSNGAGNFMRLAQAAAALNVATDCMEELRPQRQAVLDALAALSAPQGDDKTILKELRPSKKAMEKIDRIEQANAAGMAALRDMPLGSAARQGEVERLREAEHLLRYARPLVGIARSSSDSERADNARLVCQRIDAFFSKAEDGDGQ